MKLKFVPEEEVTGSTRGRKPMYPWAEFFEELYKFPNQWAEFPQTIKNATSAYSQAKKYKDVDVKCVGNPDTGEWTAYFKFIQEDEVF